MFAPLLKNLNLRLLVISLAMSTLSLAAPVSSLAGPTSTESEVDTNSKTDADTFLTETSNKNDPDLVQALQQATHDKQDNSTDLDYLVWLSDMSEKITQRVPNAFYRIRLLETVHQEAKRSRLNASHAVLEKRIRTP